MAILKVLHIVGIMNRAGAETLIMNLYRKIDRKRIQFDFLVFYKDRGDYDDEVRLLGGNIYSLISMRECGYIQFNKNLNKFFLEHNYEIVHSHLDKNSGLILRAAKRAKIPIRLAHSHTISNHTNVIIRLYREYLSYLLKKNVTHRLACSKMSGEWLFGKKEHFKIINNAIDTSKFRFDITKRINTRKSLAIDENTIVIGHIGRFVTVKNHIFLLDIFNKIFESNKSTVLILVGSGDTKSQIEENAMKMKLDPAIKFLDTRTDIEDLLCSFDVFVFPSLWEGFPVSLIEAQASGLQCYISENITDEIIITDLINKISLTESSTLWAKAVMKYEAKQRYEYYNRVANCGYDVADIAIEIQNYYLDLINSKDN